MDDRLTTDSAAAAERFDRMAGMAALAGAALSLVYAVAFVVLKNALLASLALTAGGLLSAVALFAVYRRVKPAGSLAGLGLVLGLAGVLGAAIHGAYDLAVVLHPEAQGVASGGPFPVDPRGFLTFGVSGLGVLVLSWAGLTVGQLPRNLLYLGLLFGPCSSSSTSAASSSSIRPTRSCSAQLRSAGWWLARRGTPGSAGSF